MEKQCVECKQMFRTNITVNGKRMRAHKRIRCYDCKPFGSKAGLHATTMGLKTPKAIPYDINVVSTCNLCGVILPQKSRASNGRQCATCSNQVRGYFRKRSSIEYKGGKCQDCGCVSNMKDDISKFDFHHLRDKDFEINRAHSKSWESLKKELDKCLLLCANCHRLRHAAQIPDYVIQEVNQRKNPLITTNT